MGFMFKNIESGKIYTINEIDEIAAKFWNKEVQKTTYATPNNCPLNWFDMIGHPIEDLQYFMWRDENNLPHYRRARGNDREPEFDMEEVAALLLYDNTRYSKNASDIIRWVGSLLPFIELCFHLKSLNIVGVGHGW